MLLLSLARVWINPPVPWLAAFLDSTGPRLRELSPQELGMVLWACGAWHYRPPPAWMGAAVGEVVRGLPSSSPAHMGMAVRGMAKLMYRPPREVVRVLVGHLQQHLGVTR